MKIKDEDNSGVLTMKIMVYFVPSMMLWTVKPDPGHVPQGLAYVAGGLLQALIPPRRKGLLGILAISVLYTVVPWGRAGHLVYKLRHICGL